MNKITYRLASELSASLEEEMDEGIDEESEELFEEAVEVLGRLLSQYKPPAGGAGWYYQIEREEDIDDWPSPGESMTITYFWMVRKEFYDKNGYFEDYIRTRHVQRDIPSFEYADAAESFFEFTGSDIECKAALESLGISPVPRRQK